MIQFWGEFNGKEIRKIGFTTGIAATTVLSGMFHHKASAEEVKQNENAETNSTEVVENQLRSMS